MAATERAGGHDGGSAAIRLMCARCETSFDMAPLVFGCPRCAERGVLSLLEATFLGLPPARPAAAAGRGLRRYARLLPGGDSDDWFSLGEGDTPLVRSRRIGPRLGLAHLYFKNETTNPTWSFKDRYVAVTVNVARRLGFSRAVVASTGNLGASAAAYCAAAGMECIFLAPQETERTFLDQAMLHGARVLVTTWDGRQPLFEHLACDLGWFPIGLFMPRKANNPFGIEGYRTIAYEILETLDESPAAVLFPCARGNGLYGAFKGFRDAKEWGWTSRIPAMVACQPVGSNSIEASLRSGATGVINLPPAPSIALSARETVADEHALQAVRDSGGDALSATDEELTQAVRDLGAEGLCVEPAAALGVACLPRLLARGRVGTDERIVCVVTGAGIRWPAQLAGWRGPSQWIDPTPEALDRYLSSAGL